MSESKRRLILTANEAEIMRLLRDDGARIVRPAPAPEREVHAPPHQPAKPKASSAARLLNGMSGDTVSASDREYFVGKHGNLVRLSRLGQATGDSKRVVGKDGELQRIKRRAK